MQLITPVTNFNDLGKVGNDLYNKNQMVYDTTLVPYWIEKYKDSVISTNYFSSLYPDFPIAAEDYKIVPPDFSTSADAIVVMWFLKNSSNKDKGIINLMIITLDRDSSVYYHLDYNNNRNFTDDGPAFKFLPSKRFEMVSIIDDNYVYDFRVNNLTYVGIEIYNFKNKFILSSYRI